MYILRDVTIILRFITSTRHPLEITIRFCEIHRPVRQAEIAPIRPFSAGNPPAASIRPVRIRLQHPLERQSLRKNRFSRRTGKPHATYAYNRNQNPTRQSNLARILILRTYCFSLSPKLRSLESKRTIQLLSPQQFGIAPHAISLRSGILDLDRYSIPGKCGDRGISIDLHIHLLQILDIITLTASIPRIPVCVSVCFLTIFARSDYATAFSVSPCWAPPPFGRPFLQPDSALAASYARPLH